MVNTVKNLSLIHNDQKPEYADIWFSQKTIHDETYKIFSFFKNNNYMILDIGANAGYSVSSMYSAGAACPIFSFEANEIHRRNLEYIKNTTAPQYKLSYDYAILGLGDKAGQTKFLMPVINRVALSALARIRLDDIQAFCKCIDDHIENYFSDKNIYFSIMEFEVCIDTLDSYIAKNPSKFPLPIAAIKIDTEGMEYDVLQGAVNTVQKFHPLIIVGGDSPKLREFFAEQGYKQVTYCDGKLYFNRENQHYNTVYVHDINIDHYRNIGLIGDYKKLEDMNYKCVNCCSDEYDIIYPEYSIVRCKKCNLVYSRKRKSDEELKSYYSSEYCEYAKEGNYDAVGVPNEAMDAFLTKDDKTFFHNISKCYEDFLKGKILSSYACNTQKTFIEVGCAWGACLLAAQKLGFTSVGFEISKSNCELAAKLGLDARNEEFSQADIQSASASIVFFSHSFEHITAPNDYLRKAYNVLEDGGILFLEVPNFNSYWHYRTGRTWMWLDPIAHVAQYTGEVLCNMVRAAGFTIKACATRCDEKKWHFGFCTS